MKKMIFFIIVGFITIISSKCYYDSFEYLYPELDSQCDTTSITFSVTIKDILNRNSCMGCHSNANSAAGANIKLQDYADLKVMVDNGRLMGSVLHQQGYSPMPKNGGSINNCDKIILQKWIDNQAPNN